MAHTDENCIAVATFDISFCSYKEKRSDSVRRYILFEIHKPFQCSEQYVSLHAQLLQVEAVTDTLHSSKV